MADLGKQLATEQQGACSLWQKAEKAKALLAKEQEATQVAWDAAALIQQELDWQQESYNKL